MWRIQPSLGLGVRHSCGQGYRTEDKEGAVMLEVSGIRLSLDAALPENVEMRTKEVLERWRFRA